MSSPESPESPADIKSIALNPNVQSLVTAAATLVGAIVAVISLILATGTWAIVFGFLLPTLFLSCGVFFVWWVRKLPAGAFPPNGLLAMSLLAISMSSAMAIGVVAQSLFGDILELHDGLTRVLNNEEFKRDPRRLPTAVVLGHSILWGISVIAWSFAAETILHYRLLAVAIFRAQSNQAANLETGGPAP